MNDSSDVSARDDIQKLETQMAHVEFAVSHLTIDSEIAFVAGGQGFRNVEVKQSRAACAVGGVRLVFEKSWVAKGFPEPLADSSVKLLTVSIRITILKKGMRCIRLTADKHRSLYPSP